MEQDWSDLTLARPPREMVVEESRKVGDNLYRATIFANEKARSGPDIAMRGLSFTNYRKNPVVMYAHDTMGYTASGGLPIGRSTKLQRTDEGRIVSDFEFLPDDPFAQRVQNAWDRKFLRAASISWKPHESKPRSEDEGGGWIDTKSELLEWSIVAVPADPDAVRSMATRLIVNEIGEPDEDDDEIVMEDAERLASGELDVDFGPADILRPIIREVLEEAGLNLDSLKLTLSEAGPTEAPPAELPLDDLAERVAQLHESLTEGVS